MEFYINDTDSNVFYGFQFVTNWLERHDFERQCDTRLWFNNNGSLEFIGRDTESFSVDYERESQQRLWIRFWKANETCLGYRVALVGIGLLPLLYPEADEIMSFAGNKTVNSNFWNCTLEQKIWKGGQGWIEGRKDDETIGSGDPIPEPFTPSIVPIHGNWITELVSTISQIFGLIWDISMQLLPYLGLFLVIWIATGLKECVDQRSFNPIMEKRLLPMYNFLATVIQIFVQVAETVQNTIIRILTWLGIMAGAGA
jgi:hypothetical protein